MTDHQRFHRHKTCFLSLLICLCFRLAMSSSISSSIKGLSKTMEDLAKKHPTTADYLNNELAPFYKKLVSAAKLDCNSIAIHTGVAIGDMYPGMDTRIMKLHIYRMLMAFRDELCNTIDNQQLSRTPSSSVSCQTPARFVQQPTTTSTQTDGIARKSRFSQTSRPFQGVDVASTACLRPASRNAAVEAVPATSTVSSSTVHTSTVDKQLQTRAPKVSTKASQVSTPALPRMKIRRVILSGLPTATDPARIKTALEDASFSVAKVELLHRGTDFILHLSRSSLSLSPFCASWAPSYVP